MTDPASPGQPYGGNNPYNQQQGGNPYNAPGGGQYPPPGGGGQYPPQGGGQYGQPGGTPYPPQGGNPYAPQGGEAPGPYPGMPAPPPPVKGRGPGRIIGVVVGLVVLVVVVGAIALFSTIAGKNDTTNAKVGDCIKSDALTSTTAKEVKNTKIVKCDDANANYKVVGVVANKTEVQFDTDEKICAAYPTAESALWQGEQGKAGSVLCLAPNKK